jgi:hypothetical protein
LFRESEADGETEMRGETEADRLLDRKNVIYRNLRDLDFEHKMGRLTDSDFQQLEAGYKAEAAAVLQQLERLKTGGKKIEKKAPAAGPKPVPTVQHCPSCGAESPAGKKYCGECGHHLA